jgi:GNAT superfamily N-acetyltransferase
MGEIHVRAWQVAYRGEFPDAYLEGLQPAERADLWRQYIPLGGVVVVDDDHAGVVGFASFGQSPDPAEVGELFAMNVDPDHWGRGHGSALVAHVEAALVTAGFTEAVLWTGVANERAQSLYSRLGWAPDGATKVDEVLGATGQELRFRRSF